MLQRLSLNYYCTHESGTFSAPGPNAATFIYPSEKFPVKVRTTGHGIAAAMGKLGGFLGVFTFPFSCSGAACPVRGCRRRVCLLGLIVTVFLLPETKGKSMEGTSEDPAHLIEEAAA